MEPITCKNAFYVKLGQKAMWEESSLTKQLIRVGYPQQTLSDINSGKWDKIQKQLQRETADKGTATRYRHGLQMLCASTNADIWITFHRNHLWWSKVASPHIYKDKISKYRKVDRWQHTNILGERLLISQIPGRVAKIQGFRGTICKVGEVDELTRVINGQHSPECEAILHSKKDLCRRVETGLRKLHWKDFETLVDLLFRATGWRRVSVLGGSMKFVDIELEEPITGEMYQVQVKSTATPRDLQEYTKTFSGGKYRKLFFVVHTPDKRLAETPQLEDSSVQVILSRRLAEMVVELGLLNWLLNKVR